MNKSSFLFPRVSNRSFDGLSINQLQEAGARNLQIVINGWNEVSLYKWVPLTAPKDYGLLDTLEVYYHRSAHNVMVLTDMLRKPFALSRLRSMQDDADKYAPLLPFFRSEWHFHANELVYVCHASKNDLSDAKIIQGTIRPGGPRPSARYDMCHYVDVEEQLPYKEYLNREGYQTECFLEYKSALLYTREEFEFLKARPTLLSHFLLNSCPSDKKLAKAAWQTALDSPVTIA